MKQILEKIEPIEIPKPSDIILKKIRELIISGELKPGDRLPPERYLAERFNTGRGHVREAIKKLEFYGIVRTMPQSGTIVSHLGVNLIEGMIANVIQLEKDDFNSLIETRGILEVEAARMAAVRADKEGVNKLLSLLSAYKEKVLSGEDGLEEDLLFHVHIAELCNNPVLRSIILLITPEVVQLSRKNNTCKDDRAKKALKEHYQIYESIVAGDEKKAATAMQTHMQNTMIRISGDMRA